jgi:predicted AAA+ superfamily ATPase
MFIKREIQDYIRMLTGYYPVVVLTGPRQSGKTTLLKSMYPEFEYFNLENPSTLALIENDMQGFINLHGEHLIIDEVQRLPGILSYIQASVDEHRENGRFLLSGSQNLLLSEAIGQSLAGRAAYAELLPVSNTEFAAAGIRRNTVFELIYSGGYPGLVKDRIPPQIFYDQYIATYVERDLKLIRNVENLNVFRRFLGVIAGRIGNILDYASISGDVGISPATARNWVSILEASYILKILPPYYNNFGKRYIKSPKIYFVDTGLACRLLGIGSALELETHSSRGGLFENFCIMEIQKHIKNYNTDTDLFYFRDSNGNEVDLLMSEGKTLIPIEIKSAATFSSSFLKGLRYWNSLTGEHKGSGGGFLIYSGVAGETEGFKLINFDNLTELYCG